GREPRRARQLARLARQGDAAVVALGRPARQAARRSRGFVIPGGALPRQRPILGVTLIALAASCFATMDSSSRYLGAYLPLLLFFWARYLFQATVMAVWLAARGGLKAFATAHPRFQAIRGALLAATSAMSFYGVQHMPVPEFTAINMLTPLLVIVLAGWWL